MSNGQILKDARTKVWGQAAWCFVCSVMGNGEMRNARHCRERQETRIWGTK